MTLMIFFLLKKLTLLYDSKVTYRTRDLKYRTLHFVHLFINFEQICIKKDFCISHFIKIFTFC